MFAGMLYGAHAYRQILCGPAHVQKPSCEWVICWWHGGFCAEMHYGLAVSSELHGDDET